jgi:hypothetical protein
MIYLSSPYSNDPDGNYQAMINFCRRLFTLLPAPHIFSPVIHYHPIGGSLTYDECMGLCLHMIDLAEDFWIVTLPNWTTSLGVQIESRHWVSKGRKLTAIHPHTLQRVPTQEEAE